MFALDVTSFGVECKSCIDVTRTFPENKTVYFQNQFLKTSKDKKFATNIFVTNPTFRG